LFHMRNSGLRAWPPPEPLASLYCYCETLFHVVNRAPDRAVAARSLKLDADLNRRLESRRRTPRPTGELPANRVAGGRRRLVPADLQALGNRPAHVDRPDPLPLLPALDARPALADRLRARD